MKKVITILLSFLVASMMLCCFPTEYYNIIDITFNAVEKGEYYHKETHIIKEKLLFQIEPQFELIRVARQQYFPSLIQQCYATSRDSRLENNLLQETFSLSFDKPFTYKGIIIEPYINLLEKESIKTEITIYDDRQYDDDTYYNIFIDFDDLFLSNARFSGEYTCTFSCKTSDNNYFKKEIIILFEQPKQD